MYETDYSNEFRTIRSILGSYLHKDRVWHALTKNLNTKINDEVQEFLGGGVGFVDDLREWGYLSKTTRCADPWISKKAISLKTFKILNLFISKVNLIL